MIHQPVKIGCKRPRLVRWSHLVISCAMPTCGFLRSPTPASNCFNTRSRLRKATATVSAECNRTKYSQHRHSCADSYGKDGRYRSFLLHEREQSLEDWPPDIPEVAAYHELKLPKLKKNRGSRRLKFDDRMPRSMEEIYEQLRRNPPNDPRANDHKRRKRPQDMAIAKDVMIELCAPMADENEAWWSENGRDLKQAVMTAREDGWPDKPPSTFHGKPAVWGLGDLFGDVEEILDPEIPEKRVSLTTYKAGAIPEWLPEDIAFQRTPMAVYWDSLPDVAATRRVYSLNAVDRMAALKYMMNCTDNAIHGKAGTRLTGHFLWGYVDQLDWMRRSGRLSSTPGSIKIDRDSWWGHVSFVLTIAPLAAATQSYGWPEVVSILDAEGELQRPEMARVVRAWRRVWEYNDVTISQRLLVDLPVHDTLKEGLRRAQWAAHLQSLDAVEALYGSSFDLLPPAEREFARGWCRAARLLAVAAAPTNLDNLIYPLGAGYPPERILAGGAEQMEVPDGDGVADPSLPYGPPQLVKEAEADKLAHSNTLKCIKSLRWLGTLPAPVFSTLCLLWRRSCTSYPSRRTAAQLLHRACYGNRKKRAKAVLRSLLNVFVPDLNYRKLTPPFGIDPAVHVEYDPDRERRDPIEPLPRDSGSYPINPLQRDWYDGPRPEYRAEGPLEDGDDGLAGGYGGMFPLGKEVADMGFEATERREGEAKDRLRKAVEAIRELAASRNSDARHARRGSNETPVETVFT